MIVRELWIGVGIVGLGEVEVVAVLSPHPAMRRETATRATTPSLPWCIARQYGPVLGNPLAPLHIDSGTDECDAQADNGVSDGEE